jgi:ligand-binding sensor domain-containing protein
LGLSAQISVIAQSADGTVWLGTAGQGLFYYRDSQFLHIFSSALPSNTVRAVFEDREEDLWLGTQGGLVRFSRTPVSIVPFPGGADSEFETLYLDRDQSVWIGASAHLFHIRSGAAQPVEFAQLPKVRIRTLLRGRKSDWWVGTGGAGIVHIFHGKTERFDAERGLCNDFVRAILESRDGSIWVGTDGGLTHITAKRSIIYEPANGLAYFSITSLFEDREGNIWVGTLARLACHRRRRQFVCRGSGMHPGEPGFLRKLSSGRWRGTEHRRLSIGTSMEVSMRDQRADRTE